MNKETDTTKTYIQPHIDYFSTVWEGTSQNLQITKRAVKIILDYEYRGIASSTNELKILNNFERIFLRKAKFMYKISKSITPSRLQTELKYPSKNRRRFTQRYNMAKIIFSKRAICALFNSAVEELKT